MSEQPFDKPRTGEAVYMVQRLFAAAKLYGELSRDDRAIKGAAEQARIEAEGWRTKLESALSAPSATRPTTDLATQIESVADRLYDHDADESRVLSAIAAQVARLEMSAVSHGGASFEACEECTDEAHCEFRQRCSQDRTARSSTVPSQPAHNDHPLRHWDRTCPACVAGGQPAEEPTPETLPMSQISDPTNWNPTEEFDALEFTSYTHAKKAEVLFNRLQRERDEARRELALWEWVKESARTNADHAVLVKIGPDGNLSFLHGDPSAPSATVPSGMVLVPLDAVKLAWSIAHDRRDKAFMAEADLRHASDDLATLEKAGFAKHLPTFEDLRGILKDNSVEKGAQP